MLHHKTILLVLFPVRLHIMCLRMSPSTDIKVKRSKHDTNTGGDIINSFVLLHQMNIFLQLLKGFHRRENAKCLIAGNFVLVTQGISLIKLWRDSYDTRPAMNISTLARSSVTSNFCFERSWFSIYLIRWPRVVDTMWWYSNVHKLEKYRKQKHFPTFQCFSCGKYTPGKLISSRQVKFGVSSPDGQIKMIS